MRKEFKKSMFTTKECKFLEEFLACLSKVIFCVNAPIAIKLVQFSLLSARFVDIHGESSCDEITFDRLGRVRMYGNRH